MFVSRPMIGWDVDGNEVALVPYQIEYVKALLSDRSVIMVGGRGSGRSTIIRTAERYDREYCQQGLALPWEFE